MKDHSSESGAELPDAPLEGEPLNEVTEAAAESSAARALAGRDRGRLQVLVLLVAAAASIYVIFELLAPFTPALVIAGVLAVQARPLQERAVARIHNATVAALAVTALLFMLVLLPIGGLSGAVAIGFETAVSAVTSRVEQLLDQRGPAWEAMVSAVNLVGVEEETLSETLRERTDQLGDLVAGGTLGVLSRLGRWAIQAGVGLVALFYLLRDGERFLQFIRWLIPLDPNVTDTLLAKSKEIAGATLFGTLVVAIVQGALGGLLFWFLGLPAPVLWGAVMAFFSVLPAVGPPVVWIPAALILALGGDVGRAAILVAVGALVVGTVDNLLRSILVGDRARLHPLAVFFSVLGGLVAYGPVGFLLGPILVGVAISILEIVRVAVYGDPASSS